jgi:hypothetical protein
LDIEYAVRCALPVLPLTDEVSTIEPPPAASMPGTTCLQASMAPRRFTAMIRSNTSTDRSTTPRSAA